MQILFLKLFWDWQTEWKKEKEIQEKWEKLSTKMSIEVKEKQILWKEAFQKELTQMHLIEMSKHKLSCLYWESLT